MVLCVVNLTHFFSHADFIPSNVFAPVIMLGTMGLVACLLAALGWYAAMEKRPCRLYTFSVFLIVLIISEFGGAIWALVSTVKLQDEMVKFMETSFSSYATNKDVAEKWKSLQQQMQCCGIDGPTDYRGTGKLDWSCCKQATQNEASCHSILQGGCLVSLTQDIQNRVLWMSVLSIATAIIQISGVFCSCCLSNALKAEVQRRRRDAALLKTSS